MQVYMYYHIYIRRTWPGEGKSINALFTKLIMDVEFEWVKMNRDLFKRKHRTEKRTLKHNPHRAISHDRIKNSSEPHDQ